MEGGSSPMKSSPNVSRWTLVCEVGDIGSFAEELRASTIGICKVVVVV